MTMQGRRKVQREPRREMKGRSAWMTVGDAATEHGCSVLDVAPGGARIMTDAELDVNDRFELALVKSHAKRQLCEIVWRRGNMFGVKFVS